MNAKRLLYVDTDCVISYSNRLRRPILFMRNGGSTAYARPGLKKCRMRLTDEIDFDGGNKYYLLEEIT